MGLDPSIAAVRLAVRSELAELSAGFGDEADPSSTGPGPGPGPGGPVLVACSGGADSLALAAALAFEANPARRGGGRPAGAITIDHGLQAGSAERAADVVRILRDLGLDPVESVSVTVTGPGGPEAAARDARYAALDETAARLGAAAVLLGHTLDDQAETVLLGLARGSGARSLAGMPGFFRRGPGGAVRYHRPLLRLTRATTRRACEAAGLKPWDDPHNDDTAFTRVRLRHEALPALEQALGPGVAQALARTARLLRDDADALDAWTDRAYSAAVAPLQGVRGVVVEVAEVMGLPRAVRTRVLRRAAVDAGAPPGAVGAVHVYALDRLLTAWRGQGPVDLPGAVRALRRCGKLFLLMDSE